MSALELVAALLYAACTRIRTVAYARIRRIDTCQARDELAHVEVTCLSICHDMTDSERALWLRA